MILKNLKKNFLKIRMNESCYHLIVKVLNNWNLLNLKAGNYYSLTVQNILVRLSAKAEIALISEVLSDDFHLAFEGLHTWAEPKADVRDFPVAVFVLHDPD